MRTAFSYVQSSARSEVISTKNCHMKSHTRTHKPKRLSVQYNCIPSEVCDHFNDVSLSLSPAPLFTLIGIPRQFHHRVWLLAAPFRWTTRGTGHVNDIHNCCVRHRFAEQRISVVVLVQSAHYLRLCHFIDDIGVCGIVRSCVAHVHRTNSIFSELGSRFADSDWLYR